MTGIDLDRAFAIPVLHVAEYLDLSALQLREEPGAFHPPQGHVRLGQHLNPAAATSAGVTLPCLSGTCSRTSETRSRNHSAATGPSTCSRCSANRGNTQVPRVGLEQRQGRVRIQRRPNLFASDLHDCQSRHPSCQHS
jgi:hypothetical protein